MSTTLDDSINHSIDHSMTFHSEDGKEVGRFDFNDPEQLKFTGNMDESAKHFIEFVQSGIDPAVHRLREISSILEKLDYAMIGIDADTGKRGRFLFDEEIVKIRELTELGHEEEDL